jgi:hypothetical protein
MNNYSNFYLAMLGCTFFILGFITAEAVGFMTWRFLSFCIFSLLIYLISYNLGREQLKFALGRAGE